MESLYSLLILGIAETIACMQQVQVVQKLKIASLKLDGNGVFESDKVQSIQHLGLGFSNRGNITGT